jgi:hypothetical protein
MEIGVIITIVGMFGGVLYLWLNAKHTQYEDYIKDDRECKISCKDHCNESRIKIWAKFSELENKMQAQQEKTNELHLEFIKEVNQINTKLDVYISKNDTASDIINGLGIILDERRTRK